MERGRLAAHHRDIDSGKPPIALPKAMGFDMAYALLSGMMDEIARLTHLRGGVLRQARAHAGNDRGSLAHGGSGLDPLVRNAVERLGKIASNA